jgi:myo-inositol-1-phosphate synthase
MKDSVATTKKKMGLIGASMALEAIDRETAAIYAAFPELRPTVNQPVQKAPRKASKNGRWTAKRKKEVSERMKAYWAKRRKMAKVTPVKGVKRERAKTVSGKAPTKTT